MNPNPATTTSSTAEPQAPAPDAPAPQAAAAGSAPGPQSAQSAPASPPTPRQIFWDVARLAFALMTRLIQVLHPIQSYYLEQSRQAMRVCTELCRVMLTIRFAPERVTLAQLRHLHRARHILQALFNYTLPSLGPRTSPSATPANTPSPSPNTPSPTVHAVPEVPEVPEVSGISSPNTPSAASLGTPISRLAPAPASSHAPAASPDAVSPTLDPSQSSHASHTSHASHNPQSAIQVRRPSEPSRPQSAFGRPP